MSSIRRPSKKIRVSTTTSTADPPHSAAPPASKGPGRGKNKGIHVKDADECEQQGCIALPLRKTHLPVLKGLAYSPDQRIFIDTQWDQFVTAGKSQAKRRSEGGEKAVMPAAFASSDRFLALLSIVNLVDKSTSGFLRRAWIVYLHARLSVKKQAGVHESKECWIASGTPDAGNQGIRLALPKFFLNAIGKAGKQLEIMAYQHTLLMFTASHGVPGCADVISPPEKGREVSHTCCDGSCCRPTHLYWSSHSDNKLRFGTSVCFDQCTHCPGQVCECQGKHNPQCIGKNASPVKRPVTHHQVPEKMLLEHCHSDVK